MATEEQSPRKPDSTAIGGYDLVERIGRGPRTEVWKARAQAGGKEVAVKIVSADIARRPNFLTLFEKESSALTALMHPNILSTMERGRSGGQFFLAQELIRSGSIRELMRSGGLPVQRAVRIAIGVCEALDYAHRRGLPHRHLVPENIFINASEVVRVGDFSLSLFNANSSAEGGDVAGDLYDLGALIHELVTGSRPPARYASLEGRVPGVNKRLDELLGRALAPNPGERFRRASEMSLALVLTGSDDAPRKDARADDRADAVAIVAREKLVVVSIAPDASTESVKASLQSVEQTLGAGGPWKIGYDLTGLNLLEDAIQDQILRLHVRHLKNLSRVGFCSPRAMVRAGALVIGRTNDGALPWKVFSGVDPMRQWLREVG